jgi:DNA-binding IclR family transcriptional regulator
MAFVMLGASRSTVGEIAGELQKAGFITYHRGRVTILDRAALEAASCDARLAIPDRAGVALNRTRRRSASL